MGGGVFPIYQNITYGGSPQFITVLQHDGVVTHKKANGLNPLGKKHFAVFFTLYCANNAIIAKLS